MNKHLGWGLVVVGLFIVALLGITAASGASDPGSASSPGVVWDFRAPPSATLAAAEPPVLTGPTVGHSLKNDVSPPLISIPAIPPKEGPIRETPRLPGPRGMVPPPSGERRVDPALQSAPGGPGMPSTIRNFEGVDNRDHVYPPDTEGDVGPNHFVQWVNTSFQIWDKNGSSLFGPAEGNTLWAGFGAPCETTNDGDPIALYDSIADRWLMSQFALPNFPNGPYYQCIAVSQTPDPTGAFNRYAFLVSNTKLNDYGKFGVWPDGYYLSVNEFVSLGGGNFNNAGVGLFVFDRAAMLSGQPATFQTFDLAANNASIFGLLPSHFAGVGLPPAGLPPAGSPNYFVAMQDDASGFSPTDRLQLWRFHVDWINTANTTLTGPININTDPFDSNLCNYQASCIPQPGTPQGLDALSDRLMYRLQYRHFADHESLVVNQTVDVNGADHAGIRWYEIRDPGGMPTIFQQGTYAPDADDRWAGSIAMDRDGNMALGYSVASTSAFPSIRYTGRLFTDPSGLMPQGEGVVITGSGVQTGTLGRWGDYSAMGVDPLDGCTFWYTQEYLQTTGTAPWQTRIASFRLPACGPPVAGFSAAPVSGTRPLTVTFTDSSGGAITSRLWNFGDGITSTLTSPSHVYLSAGVYTVSLALTGPDGSDTLTRTNYITVTEPPPPVAAFTALPISGTAPLSVTFTNESTGSYTSSLWDFGDGSTSTLSGPVHVYTSPGMYTVSLTVSGPGGSSTLQKPALIQVIVKVYLPFITRNFTGA